MARQNEIIVDEGYRTGLSAEIGLPQVRGMRCRHDRASKHLTEMTVMTDVPMCIKEFHVVQRVTTRQRRSATLPAVTVTGSSQTSY